MEKTGIKKYSKQLIIAGICIAAILICIIIYACIRQSGSENNKNDGNNTKQSETTIVKETTTAEPTTAEPTTAEPTTAEPTTAEPTTAEPTTAEPTTAEPTTAEPTTAEPTTTEPVIIETSAVPEPVIPEETSAVEYVEPETIPQNTEANLEDNNIVNEENIQDPYQEHVSLIRNAYVNNDTSALEEWDVEAFPKIKMCLDEAYQYSSSVDREKAVHDWICNNTVYDYDNYANNTIPYVSYTYNGVFEKGVAVCDGYSSAFILIMNIMGIESGAQLGTVRGESHSWATVKLDDGEWYNVDLTFDDGDTIGYDYFNITNAQMQAVREFYPKRECNGTTYSYMNYFLEDKDHVIRSEEDYQAFITNALQNGETNSYIYITEAVAESCINKFKYTYDTYAFTGVGASIEWIERGEPLIDGIEKYYRREFNVVLPKNFYVISSDKQLYEIARNELLNGNSEIIYVTTSDYDINSGIKYLKSRAEELWYANPRKEEYYNSHVLVL